MSLRGLGLFCCVGFGVCWEACFVAGDLKFVATFGQIRDGLKRKEERRNGLSLLLNIMVFVHFFFMWKFS